MRVGLGWKLRDMALVLHLESPGKGEEGKEKRRKDTRIGYKGQRDITAGKVLVLYTGEPGLIPSIP